MSSISHLSAVYRPGFGLLTDLYQLTMAAGYYDQRIHERTSIFHLFYRKAPFGGDFALAAGLPLAVDLINNFRFSADDVQYLGRLKGANGAPLFREPFLNYLQRMKFTGSVYGIPEGEIALPHEPLLRIEAPLVQAQLLETALLTVMNFSTLIATKAARIKAAAGDDAVLEFGLRRAQGIDGGLTASRAAFVGGCDATSNVWAGRYYDIPVKGTHAHSWVMVFPDEITAFTSYAEALPNNCIFLVDTYDTEEGVANAIRVGKQLRARGHEMLGVRLDSGDLAELSVMARRMLDEAGFPEAAVVASDSLDEYAIKDLKGRGARIDTWGIGTRLATAYDQPALGGVYKLAAIQNARGEWEDRIKLSENPIKTSYPGKLNVRHWYEPETLRPQGRVLYNEFDGAHTQPEIIDPTGSAAFHDARGWGEQQQSRELLVPAIENGRTVLAPESLHGTRARALENWKRWEKNDGDVFTGPSPALHARREALIKVRK